MTAGCAACAGSAPACSPRRAEVRGIAVFAGLALLVLGIAAASQVSDSRAGQIAEVIALLAGLVGIGLLGFAFGFRRTTGTQALARQPAPARPRSNRDLLLGAGGVLLAILLLTGLAISGGVLWAGFGLALMLPMIGGSVYLCVRFLRANP